MVDRQTGRQRAVRIPMDYFKSPNRWERGKWIATVAAIGTAVIWWTFGTLLGKPKSEFYAPGKLTSVHQTWENQCSACHAGLHAIRDDSLGSRWEGGTLDADDKCQTCHRGPPHFAKQSAAESPGCSSCHQDHRGVQASLLKMDDAACTRCHHPLHRPAERNAETTKPAITRFDATHHPEFQSTSQAPGRLKFSHSIHMLAGFMQNPGKEWEKKPWTYARIDDRGQRTRYMAAAGQKDENALVQLQCSSCHQLDGSDFGTSRMTGTPAAILPPQQSGSHMLPITFENQCQACHALDRPNLPAAIQHRQTPAEIRLALYRGAAHDYLHNSPDLLEQVMAPMPLPNHRPPISRTVSTALDERVAAAEISLSQDVCGKCHYFQPTQRPGLWPVVPPQLPQVWFQHAKFDHRAHRAVDCRQCHEGAYSDPSRAFDDRKSSYMPKMATCLQCHAPPSGKEDKPSGGARFDCAECHRYHNGENRMAGVGAQIESPAHKLNVGEFQRGGPQD